MKTDMAGAATVLGAMSLVPTLAPKVRGHGLPAAHRQHARPATPPGWATSCGPATARPWRSSTPMPRAGWSWPTPCALAAEDEPDAIIDLATLTGACMVALGDRTAGVDGQPRRAAPAGPRRGRVRTARPCGRCRCPSTCARRSTARSPTCATSPPRRTAARSTAAIFLQEFVDDIPWVHLDIAGPADASRPGRERPRRHRLRRPDPDRSPAGRAVAGPRPPGRRARTSTSTVRARTEPTCGARKCARSARAPLQGVTSRRRYGADGGRGGRGATTTSWWRGRSPATAAPSPRIFDRYSPRVLAFCTRLLNEPAHRRRRRPGHLRRRRPAPRPAAGPGEPPAWLYAIARNECTRHGRARARAVPTEDAVMACETADDLVGRRAGRRRGSSRGRRAAVGRRRRASTSQRPHPAGAPRPPRSRRRRAGRGRRRRARADLDGHRPHARAGRPLRRRPAHRPQGPSRLRRPPGRPRRLGRHLLGAHPQAGRPPHRPVRRLRRSAAAALVAPLGTLALGPAVAVFTVPDGALDGRPRPRPGCLRRQPRAARRCGPGSGEAAPGADGRRRLCWRRRSCWSLLVVGAALGREPAGDDAQSLRSRDLERDVHHVGRRPPVRRRSRRRQRPTSTTAAGARRRTVSPNQAAPTTLPADRHPGPGGAWSPAVRRLAAGDARAADRPATTPTSAPAVGSTSGPARRRCRRRATRPTTPGPSRSPPPTTEASPGVVLRWTPAGRQLGREGDGPVGLDVDRHARPVRGPGTSPTGRSRPTRRRLGSSPTASVAVDPCPG